LFLIRKKKGIEKRIEKRIEEGEKFDNDLERDYFNV